ncbi:hypothetical protein [Streptomyces sp. NPDC046985]|uniref:hypothetical protein n=1 Tax=Streptomyces sp. NPDC046985 TaxID=3155377 RepID=UPI0033C7B6DF
MVLLRDGLTGRPYELPTAQRRGLLRLRVHLAPGGRGVDAADVRALLVADVLLRALEAQGVQVLHALAGAGLSADRARTLRDAMAGLNIRPPDGDGGADIAPADAHVSAGPASEDAPGAWITVGAVTQDTPPVWRADGVPGGDGTDPLALRLALLAAPYRTPVALGPDALRDAGRTLAAWRRAVARWADSPSRPVPAAVAASADAALADDLGTPGVLDVLREVEADDAIPDGARFETFALLDRVLGLELSRDVGRA